MPKRCKVCWLHPRLRLWVENELLLANISLREASQQLKKHNIQISQMSLCRHKKGGHMAPTDLTPIQKIDYYIEQLQPQQAKLRKHQLIIAQIQQWQQLQKWHQTKGQQEQAEADQEQIRQLKQQLT